jgi:addiction module RelE/StbE family toxin
MSHLSWSQRATKDLQKIAEYIRSYSLDKEVEVTTTLIVSADQLRVQPHSGQKRDTLSDGSILRSLLVRKKYRLVYRVTPSDDVEILQVIDVRSDYEYYR